MGGKYARAKNTDILTWGCVDMYVKCEYVLSVLLSSLRLTNTFLCSLLNRSIVCLSVDVCEGVYLCECVYILYAYILYVCVYKSVQSPTKFVFRFVRFYGGDARLIAVGCARHQRSR